jgi:hypothetical protein
MRDHEPSIVENVVRDQTIDELDHILFELGRLTFKLSQRLGQPVRDLNVAASQSVHQLDVVIAGDAQRRPALDQPLNGSQHARSIWTPVDQVAQEHGFASVAMLRSREIVPKRLQQRFQLGAASMHVAYDVKRPPLISAISP